MDRRGVLAMLGSLVPASALKLSAPVGAKGEELAPGALTLGDQWLDKENRHYAGVDYYVRDGSLIDWLNRSCVLPTDADDITAHGVTWGVVWTGWKAAVDHMALAGQWLAWPKEERRKITSHRGASTAASSPEIKYGYTANTGGTFDSSVVEVLTREASGWGICSPSPGPVRRYRKGDLFDLTQKPHQRVILADGDPPAVLLEIARNEKALAQALLRSAVSLVSRFGWERVFGPGAGDYLVGGRGLHEA